MITNRSKGVKDSIATTVIHIDNEEDLPLASQIVKKSKTFKEESEVQDDSDNEFKKKILVGSLTGFNY